MSEQENSFVVRTVDSFETFALDCRKLAAERLASITGKTWEQVEIDNWDRLLFSSNMTMITLAGKDLRVFIKVHYRPKKTKATLSHIKSNIFDMFNEYTNLLAGAIKQMLFESGVVCGLSLPNSLSGIDEVILSDIAKSNRFKDCFSLKSNDLELFVTISTDVTSDNVKNSILVCKAEDIDSGEVEFL